MSEKFDPEDMPILDLDLSKTKRFEASRFLDSPETIAAFLAEAMKANDAQILMHALGEVAKARGVNQFAQDAGVNRESLYKTLHTQSEHQLLDGGDWQHQSIVLPV